MHLAATTSQVFHFHSLLLYHFSSTLETFLYPYLLLSLSRYVDMIANPEVAETFRKRAKIISEIRKTVESSGFVEVETPVLQGAAGGAEARPFITYHNSLGQDLYLRIATELHLKRMLVGGFEKVYEIGRIFRNEGISTRHNPEFTTIEMYEAYSDYESMMNMTEEIITQCALAVNGKLTLDYQGVEICLERPWRRETMHNLVKEAIGIEFNKFGDDLNAAKKVVLETPDIVNDNQNKNLIEACTSVGHVLNEVFEIVVEPKLMQPTFVLDYPIEISPLAKPHRRHSGLTERFELFICGREMANAFSELTDPLDQRERLEEQVRQHNNKKAAAVSEISSTEDGTERADDSYDVTLDEDFLTALEYGMPPASGMASNASYKLSQYTRCDCFPCPQDSAIILEEYGDANQPRWILSFDSRTSWRCLGIKFWFFC
ncbi:lysine--tRNA ligase, chloroplastic/mitochondrial-like isoform X2 [Olea europaea var. sylvestris]|uniref:lysine--tRNA ligase, chloroplastic/mitochondrial-like isoform X2 n=1 Tax=Olea europaea var. sylvestris TaxID=158386 RepID=UPI000C1D6F58|nr:lysine--tRNA ligase, chloroplastic/mitochondrial-like isoform X2 [Olea europaea var. sylvestris]